MDMSVGFLISGLLIGGIFGAFAVYLILSKKSSAIEVSAKSSEAVNEELRQGFGRLIRGTDDRGVIAILDTRLVRSSYGRSIVSSMPKMDIVHKKEAVQHFFDEIQEDAPANQKKVIMNR